MTQQDARKWRIPGCYNRSFRREGTGKTSEESGAKFPDLPGIQLNHCHASGEGCAVLFPPDFTPGPCPSEAVRVGGAVLRTPPVRSNVHRPFRRVSLCLGLRVSSGACGHCGVVNTAWSCSVAPAVLGGDHRSRRARSYGEDITGPAGFRKHFG